MKPGSKIAGYAVGTRYSAGDGGKPGRQSGQEPVSNHLRVGCGRWVRVVTMATGFTLLRRN